MFVKSINYSYVMLLEMLKLFKVWWIPCSPNIRTIIKTVFVLGVNRHFRLWLPKITVCLFTVCIWRVKQSPTPWFQGPLLTGCQEFPVQFLPQANSPWPRQRRTLMRGVMLATKVQTKCSIPDELTATHMISYLYQEFSKWGPWTPTGVYDP